MADGGWRRFAVAWCLQWQELWNSWWSSIDQNSDQHSKNATNCHSPPLIMWHWSHSGRKDPRAVSQHPNPQKWLRSYGGPSIIVQMLGVFFLFLHAAVCPTERHGWNWLLPTPKFASSPWWADSQSLDPHLSKRQSLLYISSWGIKPRSV